MGADVLGTTSGIIVYDVYYFLHPTHTTVLSILLFSFFLLRL
jgi:hypothetical protein